MAIIHEANLYHECTRFHYGDQNVRRDDCERAAIEALDRADRVALTFAHPAARFADRMLAHLTTRERAEVLCPGLIERRAHRV